MKNIKIEIKWAFVFIVMMLAWMLMEKLTGLHDKYIVWHAVISNFVAILAVLVYIFALKDKKKNYYSGVVSYKQLFISGLIMTAIITLFSPLTQYITTEIISPDYFNNIINYSTDKGFMSKLDAEAYFNLKSYILQTLIFTPVMGIITTAIVAIFLCSRKKNSE